MSNGGDVQVPEGWGWKKIGEIASKVGSGITPKGGSKVYQTSGVKFIRSQNIHFSGLKLDDIAYISDEINESMSSSQISDGDVLLNITGASIGRCTYVPHSFGAGNVNQHVCIVRPRISVDSKYLSSWLASDYGQNAIFTFQAGGNREGLNFQQIRGMALPIPPLPEQKKIASILTSVDDVIEKTEAQISKLQDLKKGMMTELLTKGIGHTEFKDSPVGRIPVSWAMSTCGDVCKEIVVGIVIKPTQYYQNEGVPALRSANVREEGLNKNKLKFISDKSNSLLVKSKLQDGDVVTVRTGYPGTTAVVTKDFTGCNCVDLIISRPSSKVNSSFLTLWVNSDFGKGQVLKVQGGLAQQHFNVGDMKKMIIAVPPISEQKQIVQHHTVLNNRIAYTIKKLSHTKALKKALMNDLLTGKKRVTITN